jgi:23S rRNA (guanosine2251-2'-O)-methyltransferase
VAEALTAGRRLVELRFDPRADVDELVQRARDTGVGVRAADAAELDRLAGGVRHQGVVAVAPAAASVSLDDLVGTRLVVVLDGITDPQNLGAIARSAEVAGADGLVLRSRRAAGVTPAAEKAAAGAFSWLPVAVVPNIAAAIATLTDGGAWSVGLDGDTPDDLWSCPLLDGNVVLVIGAEGEGLSRLVRERVDQRVRIPMAGHVASLNASAAAAVALFEIARRRRGA